MKSVKKIFKLLCCVLVTVLIFGGDVLAATVPNKITIQSDESNIWYDSNGRWSTVKKAISGSDIYYALCLDSSKIADKTTNGMTLNTQLQSTYSSGYQSKIKYILLKAYQLGLGNGENSHSFTIPNDSGKKYTVSDKDLYGITQSAVWYAAHGSNDDGYTNAFQSWIKNNKYDKIFEYLNNNAYNNNWINLAGPGSSMTEDGDYLVSKETASQHIITGSNQSDISIKDDENPYYNIRFIEGVGDKKVYISTNGNRAYYYTLDNTPLALRSIKEGETVESDRFTEKG